MEGWDGTDDGRPTELVERRWRRFGSSGAKLVWGGEAAAVRPEGRANPHQLVVDRSTIEELAALRAALVDEHERHIGATDDLLIGLQLTHSGRFARPDGSPRPVIAYHHPVLDSVVGAEDMTPISDDELDSLAATFVDAARLAQQRGLRFRRRQALSRLPVARDVVGVRSTRSLRRRFRGTHELRAHRASAASDAAAPDLAVGVRLEHLRPHAVRRRRRTRSSGRERRLPLRVRWRRHGTRHRPHGTVGVHRSVARARCRDDLHHGRQPVLQPARPTAGLLPAVRRLRTAGGSPRRRGPPARCHGDLEARPPRGRVRGLGLQLSAGLDRSRRPAPGRRRCDRRRRPRPHGAQLSGSSRPTCSPGGRSTDRASAAPSATARPRPAMAWCRVVIRSTPPTRPIPTGRSW